MNNADLIFDEWAASLRSRDKKIANVRSNFEELFEKLASLKETDETLTKELLADVYLPKAIKEHQPSFPLAKKTYEKVKNFQNKSQKEFIDGWNKEIKDIATETFFDYFPNDVEVQTKVYGNLGKAEYQHQRRLSAQFPILDTTELERRMHEKNEDLDLEDLKRALLGGTNNE